MSSEPMTRFEIIVNQAVESDFLDLLDEVLPGCYYTLLPGILGRGRQGYRKGDAVWPERNGLVIIYASVGEETRQIMKAVNALKQHFPREGIKMFAFEVMPLAPLGA